MSRIGALDGLDRFDWTVVVGAAVVALVPAGLVASSLGIGLARTVEDEMARDGLHCSDGMSIAVTARGETACVDPGTRLPKGWHVVFVG